MPPVGAPAAPPPDALEEHARPTGGRAAAQSARCGQGEAAEAAEAAGVSPSGGAELPLVSQPSSLPRGE